MWYIMRRFNKIELQAKDKEVEYMAYDYRKLLGRIVEKYGTQAKFATAMGMSEHTLSKKLNNIIRWKQDEITRACDLLDIAFELIPVYFFALEVQ